MPAFPYFAVDGGKSYRRRLFTRKEDYVETSVEEPGIICSECGCEDFHKMGCSLKHKPKGTNQ